MEPWWCVIILKPFFICIEFASDDYKHLLCQILVSTRGVG